MVKFDRPRAGLYYVDCHAYAGRLQGVYCITNSEASWARRGWHPTGDTLDWDTELRIREEAKVLAHKIWDSLDFEAIEKALA
jgi:hypothetical protein